MYSIIFTDCLFFIVLFVLFHIQLFLLQVRH